jgi:hypothetical protein
MSSTKADNSSWLLARKHTLASNILSVNPNNALMVQIEKKHQQEIRKATAIKISHITLNGANVSSYQGQRRRARIRVFHQGRRPTLPALTLGELMAAVT